MKRINYRVNFLVNEFDYQFLQNLKHEGISISEYLRSSIRNTSKYKSFYKILIG